MDVIKLLCAKEVALILGVSERSAARLMRKGEIKAFKMSGAIWRTTVRYVREYVERELVEREERGCLGGDMLAGRLGSQRPHARWRFRGAGVREKSSGCEQSRLHSQQQLKVALLGRRTPEKPR